MGASHTGDDLVVGTENWAEDPTTLWGQVRRDSFFDGQAILVVEVAKRAEDPDDYVDDDGVRQPFTPAVELDGVVATGWSGRSPGNPLGGKPGGTGVIGVGGRSQGTGVVGKGGGIHDPDSSGVGGVGLHGLGGSLPDPDVFPETPPAPPGAGVVGQGGRQSRSQNTSGLSHGAGVIGIGGGTGPRVDFLPQHDLTVTGGAGVYGQGAEQSVEMVHDPATPEGPLVPSGPPAPGTGVVARGGQPNDPAAPGAAGVVAVAGGEPIPTPQKTAGVGAFGAGDTGVYGLAPDREAQGNQGLVLIPGVGVRGEATGKAGRAGQFQSVRSAQIQLVPIPLSRPFPTAKPTSPTHLPTAADEGSVADFLPSDGQGGDIIALMDRSGESTLWFCVRGAGASQALWAQVLLGPTFAGTS